MSESKNGTPGRQELSSLDRELLADAMAEEKRRRGIKFLPNAITTCAMFFGFLSVMLAFHRNFVWAVWSLVAAGVCDLLDGRIARLTKSTSPFGGEYDSLSDLIAFGLAPAMIAYFWALEAFGRLGWAVAFVYLACTAIRLAKFNTLVGEEESRKYFRGIPSPCAAGAIITVVMMHINYYPENYLEGGQALPPDAYLLRGGMLAWVAGISLLMVSNIRFRTFKDINFTKYGPFYPLLGLAAIIAVFMARPYETLFAAAMCYLALGLVEGGIILRRREAKLREAKRKARRERRLKKKAERKQRKLARRKTQDDQSPPFRAINGEG